MVSENAAVELQSKFAFLEHTVETLNDVIIEQGRELERLRKQFEQLEDRVKGSGDGSAQERDPLDERPPHY
ncbi:MAG: SlyX protein [Planctomycetota bacterium]|jgi:SlyX protein